MRLSLLILFPSFAFGFLDFGEFIDHLLRAKDQIESRFGNISAVNKAKLLKAWGINLEARRVRLDRLMEMAAETVGDLQIGEISDELKKIVKIHTEKPSENVARDLFEVNNREGVSKYLFQGDIHLTESQLNTVENELSGGHSREKRQASATARKWTDNTVYFFFDPVIDERTKRSVRAAHEYIQSKTCINFVENSNAPNRIRVYNGAGCSSEVGMVGGEQYLSLGSGCQVIGTVAHEFAHALGIWHTQMRSDRDDFIYVDLTDVIKGYKGNFVKLDAAANILYTPYEYGSFMHYRANSFTRSENSLSIIPKDSKYTYTMGNEQITFYDIQMINEFYGCDAVCSPSTSARCKNGGVPNPRNCRTCNCPLGYGGDLCDQRPAGCGETLTATENWQNYEIHVGNKSSYYVRDVFIHCNHWITAPVGKTIEVRINDMLNSQCNYGCPFNGMEIKADSDVRMTNQIFCCSEFNKQIIRSFQNPTPVISFNRYFQSTFSISYRFVDGPKFTTKRPFFPPSTTTTTKKPKENGNCADKMPATCESYVSKDGDCSKIPEYARKDYCAKSCGYCEENPTILPIQPTKSFTKKPRETSSCEDREGAERCSYYVKGVNSCPELRSDLARFYCARSCGFCDSTPTPEPPPPPTLPPTPATNCVDLIPDTCAAVIAARGCQGADKESLLYYCKKSCGYCSSPHHLTTQPPLPPVTTESPQNSFCKDEFPSMCSAEISKRGCGALHPEKAKRFCAKSCGYCVSSVERPFPSVSLTSSPSECRDVSDLCPSTSQGCSDLHPIIANEFCSKSCGFCSRRTCQDTIHCPSEFTANGCAALSPSFAQQFCAKSCGFCTSSGFFATEIRMKEPTNICEDMDLRGDCSSRKAAGFCASPQSSFQFIKYSCGKTCGLCGKAASPCEDISSQCSLIAERDGCRGLHPMAAEFYCAKSCGFCDHPN